MPKYEVKSKWCWCKSGQGGEDCNASAPDQIDRSKYAYVQNWVDTHRQFFRTENQPVYPMLTPNTSPYSYGTPQVHYFYSEPVALPINTGIVIPHIVKSPHPISPLKVSRHIS